ncbi:MAG: DinB family protein [Phycisphaerales bacterium]
MGQGVEHFHRVLSATPQTLRALLGDLPDDLACANYGPDTFSPFDVLGHLIVGEREDWIPRARIILEHGESRPFTPFDHTARLRAEDGWTTASLLDAFARLRGENLAALDAMALTDADLAKTGTHPAFGRVTLGQLLTTWATHDLHHIAQVCKALAFQHRDGVGPWRAYLGILPRE